MSGRMPTGKRREQDLVEKIRSLPADKLAEVEDFVDFLRQREEEVYDEQGQPHL